MNQLLSKQDKEKYLQILAELNCDHEKLFTNKELSNYLKISERKILDFKKSRVIDFWLLCQYAAIIGREITFRLY